MNISKVIVCCWGLGHETELLLNLKQEQSLATKISKMRFVCPKCLEMQLGNKEVFIKKGQTVFSGKSYKCEKGHISVLTPFTNGMLNLKFSSTSFENIEGTLEELDKLPLTCYHEDSKCGLPLSPVDDFQLSYPQILSFRTKTRVGDLWDKAGIKPVKPGHYDKDWNYVQSDTETAHKQYLKRNKRKRNIPLSDTPGTPQ